jgi:uncharacterized protein (TIGR03435 family)
MRMRTILAGSILMLGPAFPRWAQSQPHRPAFEVASIKENTGGGPPIWMPERSGDRITLRKVRLDVAINYAWHIDNLYEVSFPASMPDALYDIEAKTDGVPDEEHLRLMFQTLLEERCKLKTHFETREIAQYILVVSKAGKLRAANPDSVMKLNNIPMRAGTASVLYGPDVVHFMGKGVSVDQIADSLSRNLRAPVRNMTGLAGAFDFDVPFTREDDPVNNAVATSLQEAVQRELGLRLDRGKGPAKVLVVDRVEKPTAN